MSPTTDSFIIILGIKIINHCSFEFKSKTKLISNKRKLNLCLNSIFTYIFGEANMINYSKLLIILNCYLLIFFQETVAQFGGMGYNPYGGMGGMGGMGGVGGMFGSIVSINCN